ncbi:MAG TPA: EamA family transporter RarD [Steroidobacteraceae bacterium]|nr:EamA family transporter RarD [Steroidobacteraceae bacterium]
MGDNAPRGALAAGLAFFIWGLFPLYWKLVGTVPALQVLAHRGLWCAVAVWLVLLARREFAWIGGLSARLWMLLALGGVLITVNWGVYVWAVARGHVIDTSLGYFITPLVNVLLAIAVLRERPTWPQWIAVGIAGGGVLLLTMRAGQLPWIALALACSFGLYGLVRKLAVIDAMHGLAVESGLMLLPALAYLWWCAHAGELQFLRGAGRLDMLLVMGGPVTAIPLTLFAWGTRRVSLLAIAVMQYLTPTVQLLLGVWFFHEPFGNSRQLAFVLIWVALALFTGEALWRYRKTTAVTASSGAAAGK